MSDVVPMPAPGGVFLDSRGSDRALRVTWHHEAGMVVLSFWRNGTCAATFRLDKADVIPFVDALVAGLADGYQLPQQRSAYDAG
ncbi:MAG: hypothetical protein GEU93_05380 [Propionibacteriales bacterium]|nr:hypothetical protein [Propionibacteriales bacterium]